MKKTLLKTVEALMKKVNAHPFKGPDPEPEESLKDGISSTLRRNESFTASGKPLLLDDRKYNLTTDRREGPALSQEERIRIQNQLVQQKEIIELVLQTQEEERKRIAEGLHNGLGQLLYAIKLKFESLALHHHSPDQSTPAQIEALLNEAIEQTRTISFELMPAILKDFGLETTIGELCKRHDSGPVKFHFSYSVANQLDGPLETAIFRMVQELVNNILRHSKASEAYILIQEIEKAILVKVKDNGQGFETGLLQQVKGIGICSIQNRIKLLDGEFKIHSSLNKGTEVILKIPRT